jgi:phosphoesterase RecJ-like protein
MATFDDIEKLLSGKKRLLVATHRNPDGDAVGSALAVGHMLRSLGLEAVCWIAEGVPRSYAFLEGAAEAVRRVPDGERFDATIVVDTADEAILGAPLPAREVTGPVIVIDHHKARKEWGDLYFYRDAAAVGEIIYDLSRHLGVPMTPAFAECVYTAVLTDTGSFHYESTSASVMRMAAACIDAGVSPWKVSLRVYESFPRSRIELLVDVLATLRVDMEGRFATLMASPETLGKHGLGPDALEDFVNYARAIEGVEVAALLRVREDGAIRVSLRSRGRVDVSSLAQRFGGGGHFGAAGCTLTHVKTMDEARELIRKALEEILG